jgi:transposase
VVKKNALKPWRVKSWCIGKPSASYVQKMEDVLAVYERPPDPLRPVVCADETGKALQATPRGRLPARPERVERQDYEYQRRGSRNLFLALDPHRGWRTVQVTEQRTALDFAEFLRQLVEEVYPDAEQIVLVTDNLNTHKPACLYERFPPAQARRLVEKLEWHYTPEHGSWLNLAECELSVLAGQCLDQRFADAAALEQAVTAWQTERNAAHKPVQWHFTTAEARIKLKRLYPKLD